MDTDLRVLRLGLLTVALLATLAGCTPSPEPDAGDAQVQEVSVGKPADPRTAWPRVALGAPLPTDRPLRAAFLLVDGVYNTELVAPFDILDHVRFHTQPGIDVFTVSQDGGPVTTAEGLAIQADHSFADAPAVDILVVASAEHSRDSDLENQALIAWVGDTGRSARYVMSLCWGAFVLGEAGLLDDRAATTFPRDFDTFAERFERATVHRGPTFVHDGSVITSQGGVRSFDAAMYLVDHLYGPEIARGIGGGLLIDWPYAANALAPHIVIP